jgi:hypothetical protein
MGSSFLAIIWSIWITEPKVESITGQEEKGGELQPHASYGKAGWDLEDDVVRLTVAPHDARTFQSTSIEDYE